MFDPLDRKIIGYDDEGEEIAVNIKAADLRDNIMKMVPMESTSMNIPLDNEKYNKLTKMLNDERLLCQNKADEQMIEARSQGNDFKSEFAKEGIV